MQETQNTELFSDLSAKESATINGGCGCDSYSRPVNYYRNSRRVNYYNSYEYSRPVRYNYRYSSYGSGGYRSSNCY